MPATKITELTAISTVNTTVDPLAIVDVSDTTQASSGTTKKITVSQIDAAIFGSSGSKAIVVDNVAALKALTVSGITDGQFYITRGYYSDNDGGQGTYIYDSASAASDNGGTVIAPTAGSGRFLLQYSAVLNVAQFGAKGDWNGSTGTDDTVSLSNAFASSSGKSLLFQPSKTYKATSRIQMVQNTSLDLNGSTLEFVLTGAEFCLLPVNGCSVVNGTVKNTGSSPSGSGQYQCPICIGEYGNGYGYSNITVDNITLISNRDSGSGIIVLGESSNIAIQNITAPGDSTTSAVVEVHWGGANSPSSGTFHPNSLLIKNIKAGSYTKSDSTIVYLSGCYNACVENVVADEVGGSLVTVFCGDYGFYYAPQNVKSLSSCGISIKNCKSLSSVKYGYVLWMEAFLAPGTPIYNSHGVVFENCSTKGKNASSLEGFRLEKCNGGTISRCVATNHLVGIITSEGVSEVTVSEGEFFNNYEDGIYISNVVSNPKSMVVDGVKVYGNGVTSSTKAGIFVNNGDGHIIKNNIIGASSESVQLYGIKIGSSVTNAIVENNKCLGLKSSGVSYQIGDSSSWVTRKFSGNSSVSISSGSIFSGPNPIIVDTINHGEDYGNRVNYILSGNRTPLSGTWTTGDRVINSNPTSTNQLDWVCISSGTPGTWVTNVSGTANRISGYDANGNITSLADVHVSSNSVGIGSSANFGSVRLAVYGSGSSAATSSILLQNSSSGNSSASDGLLIQLDSLNGYIYNQEAGPLYFGTSNQTKVTIDSNGNVYPTSGTVGMTNGFFYIPSGGGNPSGTPTSVSGRVPMYYDATNNRFYIYNGSWKYVAMT